MIGDIADSQTLAPVLKRVDAIMHFAAFAYVGESVREPRKYFENNLRDGLIFLHTVLESNVRKLVFSSTCAVYGIPSQLPITEDTPCQPANPYGATKLAFEHALEAYDAANGLRFMSFR